MSDIPDVPPAGASLYLRPIWFADTPVGLAESDFARLAGGLIWFQAVEVRWTGVDGQAAKAQVPLGLFDAWRARLPDPLAERAAALMAALTRPRGVLTLGERILRFDQPQVMGILNMTPDSFSDGGKLIGDAEKAADAGFAMQLAGAAILDIGGESTRPGAATVWEGDEIARTVPVIERLARSGIVMSIDTRKAAVMEAALAAGAGIVNDVTGLTHDPRALIVGAAAGCRGTIRMAARSNTRRGQSAARPSILPSSTGWRHASRPVSQPASTARKSSSIRASASARRCRTTPAS